MRLLGNIVIGIIYLAILAKLVYLPTDEFEVKLYKGQQSATVANISSDILSSTVSLKRFPFDTLVYAPIKLIPYFDVYFSSDVHPREGRPKPLKKRTVYNNSLGYCYLLSLTYNESVLPVTDLKSRVTAYDVSNYTNETSFNLETLDVSLMSDSAFDTFLNTMSKVANTKLTITPEPTINSVIEIRKGEEVRYVFCYYINDTDIFVYDPEHPDNTSSKINNGVYPCLTEEWDVSNVYILTSNTT